MKVLVGATRQIAVQWATGRTSRGIGAASTDLDWTALRVILHSPFQSQRYLLHRYCCLYLLTVRIQFITGLCLFCVFGMISKELSTLVRLGIEVPSSARHKISTEWMEAATESSHINTGCQLKRTRNGVEWTSRDVGKGKAGSYAAPLHL